MPLTSFTISGSEMNPRVEGFDIRETAGGVSTLACEVESEGSPVISPSVFEEVIVEEDGERIFAGHITQVLVRGNGGPNLYDPDGAPQIVTTITAEDYNRYAERIHITATVADGTTLETFLGVIATAMTSLGVTVHPSQATGPSLPAMEFVRIKAVEVLKSLSDATGYTWRIDYDKQLRMWAPGDLLAPFDIDEYDDPPRWTGDVEVERILGDEYANRVILVIGPIQEDNRIEAFIGDGVTDTFQLGYYPTLLPGIIHRYETVGHVIAGGETFGVPPDAPLQWEWDPTTNTITRTIGPTEAGFTYELTFNGFLSLEAVAEDAGEIALRGLYEYVSPSRSDVTTQAAADALAQSILDEKLVSGDQIVSYDTRWTAPTLRAGQQQTLSASGRSLTGNYLIQDMRATAETPVTAAYATSGLGILRTIRAKKHQLVQGKWQHTYDDWLKVGKGGTAVSAAVAPPAVSSGPSPPPTSVQFNRSGVFGGDASFTYDEANNSVVMGEDSDITAATFESCFIAGQDCHITDP